MAAKNPKRPGKKIDDSKIIHVWKCPDCGAEAQVPPAFYAESGTPICQGDKDCDGNDMEYVETRLLD